VRNAERKVRNGESSQTHASADPLAFSLLSDFLYCSRRAALKVISGLETTMNHLH